MKNIWLIQSQSFHTQIIPYLTEKGINILYICSTPKELVHIADIVPNCILHSSWDAMQGRPPISIRDNFLLVPPDANLLEQMSKYESTTLLMFGRLDRGGLGTQGLRHFYIKIIALWNSLLKRIPPQAVIFQSIPHMGCDYILYALCQIYGIETLIIDGIKHPNRAILIRSINEMPKMGLKLDKNLREGKHDTEDSQYLDKSPSKQAMQQSYMWTTYVDDRKKVYRVRDQEKSGKIHLINQILENVNYQFNYLLNRIKRHRSLFNRIQPYSLYGLSDLQPRMYQYIMTNIKDTIYRLRLMWYYESQAQIPDYEHDYIYYALSYQPEKNTIPMGGIYSDLLLALDTIIHALPPGWIVYVKEHPVNFTKTSSESFRLVRNKRFYDTILAYGHDKVKLIRLSEPSLKLASKSCCTASVGNSSAGWEAVRQGIPAIVFGTSFYMNCPGVYQVSSVKECSEYLNKISSGEVMVYPNEVASYINWLTTEASFQGYTQDSLQRYSGMTVEENARSYADEIISQLGVN